MTGGRLRRWLDRPLADADRAPLFAGVLLVLVVGAAVFAATRPEGSRMGAAESAPRSAPAAVASVEQAPSEPVAERGERGDAPAPSEEGRPAARFSRADGVVVRRAARRFLAGYVPYTYGQRRASTIDAATPTLRARLAHTPPRVPAAERRRRPRITGVQLASGGVDSASALGLVEDGTRRYSVGLRLVRRGGRWRVSAVGA